MKSVYRLPYIRIGKYYMAECYFDVYFKGLCVLDLCINDTYMMDFNNGKSLINSTHFGILPKNGNKVFFKRLTCYFIKKNRINLPLGNLLEIEQESRRVIFGVLSQDFFEDYILEYNDFINNAFVFKKL